MSLLCSQNRVIQKCLFNKLKENTVQSVSGLSILIDDTHESLMEKISETKLIQKVGYASVQCKHLYLSEPCFSRNSKLNFPI